MLFTYATTLTNDEFSDSALHIEKRIRENHHEFDSGITTLFQITWLLLDANDPATHPNQVINTDTLHQLCIRIKQLPVFQEVDSRSYNGLTSGIGAALLQHPSPVIKNFLTRFKQYDDLIKASGVENFEEQHDKIKLFVPFFQESLQKFKIVMEEMSKVINIQNVQIENKTISINEETNPQKSEYINFINEAIEVSIENLTQAIQNFKQKYEEVSQSTFLTREDKETILTMMESLFNDLGAINDTAQKMIKDLQVIKVNDQQQIVEKIPQFHDEVFLSIIAEYLRWLVYVTYRFCYDICFRIIETRSEYLANFIQCAIHYKNLPEDINTCVYQIIDNGFYNMHNILLQAYERLIQWKNHLIIIAQKAEKEAEIAAAKAEKERLANLLAQFQNEVKNIVDKRTNGMIFSFE